MRNVGTSSTVFATTERTRRKLGIGRIKGSLAVTSKSRKLGEAPGRVGEGVLNRYLGREVRPGRSNPDPV